MTWIDELLIKRIAQQTTVFIVETFDLRRIDELIEACPQNFKEHEVLRLDIQTGELKKIAVEPGKKGSGTSMPSDDGAMQQLHRALTTKATVGVITYVLVAEQAQGLYNHMLSWHREGLYGRDRINTVVIFTASAEFFPAALRRFVHTISIPAATPEERQTILQRVVDDIKKVADAKGQKVNMSFDSALINASAGLTLQDVEAAAFESFYRHRNFKIEEFTKRKMEILRQFGIEFINPTRGFETIAGYHALKDYISWRVIKPLQKPSEAQKRGMSIPKGVLLIGLPGCGKTYFARALAKEVGLSMLKITPADFLRSFVGETEARVKQITNMIETLAPVLVFIDEFDQFALERSTTMVTDSGASRRSQNMLLDWMSDENRKSFIIGATNFARLDKAFVRPGRIDEVLVVLPPDTAARREMLEVHTKVVRKVPTAADVDLKKMADKTKWWSGAEIEKLVLDAAALSFRDNTEQVTAVHFEEALKGFEVNIDEREKSLSILLLEVKMLEAFNKQFLETQMAEFQKVAENVSKAEGIFTSGDLGRPTDRGVGMA